MKIIVDFFIAFILSITLTFAQKDNITLSDSDKNEIIENTVILLNENYVFPDIAHQMEKHLRRLKQEGFFDTIYMPKNFVEIITSELQSICHDKHVRLTYDSQELYDEKKTEDEQEIDRLISQLNPEHHNSGIDKVEIFNGNIGYISINHVMYSEEAEEALSSAFRILSNTFTIIIDLRNNGGGQPEYMEYCLAYFFDKPTHINSFYRRDTDEMEDFWTVENIPGKKMPDIPLFVLTSDKTFSGGEEFTYDLQALKRAKIIGDTTAGGAHPARTWDLYKNMFIMIPFGRAVNPVTGTNWEGVGVIPDIPVIAENALDTAKLYAKLSADQYWNDRKEIIIESYNEFLEKLQIAERTYTNNPKKAANMIYSNLVEMSDSDIFDQMAIDRLGYKYLDKGNIQMAIEIFKSIVRIYPESANVYDSLGEAYYENKDWERAISNYEKALELDPESVSAKEALQELQLKNK